MYFLPLQYNIETVYSILLTIIISYYWKSSIAFLTVYPTYLSIIILMNNMSTCRILSLAYGLYQKCDDWIIYIIY